MRTLSLLRIRACGEICVRFRKFDLIKDTSDRGSPRLLHCLQVCPTFRREGKSAFNCFASILRGNALLCFPFSSARRRRPLIPTFSPFLLSSAVANEFRTRLDLAPKGNYFSVRALLSQKIKQEIVRLCVKIVLLIGGDVLPRHSEYFL